MKKAACSSIKFRGLISVLAALLTLALAMGALPGCGATRAGGQAVQAEESEGYCLWLLWVQDEALLKEVQSRMAAGQHFVTVSRQIIAAHPKRARQHANCLVAEKIDPEVLKRVSGLGIGKVSKPFAFKDGHALVMRTTESYRRRGHAFFRQRDYANAEKALLKDLKLHPGSESSWHYVGRARAAQGNLKGAIEALAKAQTLAPRKPGNYFYLGLAYQEDGRYQQALAQFRRAAELAPKNPALLAHLALALMQQKQELAGAELLARRSVRLAPKRAQSWIALGQVLKARGKKAEAVSAFHRAMLLEPKGSAAGQALLATMLQLSPGQVARLYGGRVDFTGTPPKLKKPKPATVKKAAPKKPTPVLTAKPVAKAAPPTPAVAAKAPAAATLLSPAPTTSTTTTTTTTTTEARPFAITTSTTTTLAPATTVVPVTEIKPTTTTTGDGQVARGKIPPLPTVTAPKKQTTTTLPVKETTTSTTTSTSTTTTEPPAATTTTQKPRPAPKAVKPSKPAGKPKIDYFVQVSTNHKESLAARHAKYWRKKGVKANVEVWISPKGDRWYRVLLGPYNSRAAAIKLGRKLKKSKKVKFYRVIGRQVEP